MYISAFLFSQKFLGRNLMTNSSAGNSTNSTIPKTVTAAPYKIASCEQVVEINAKTLLDYKDFSKKGPAFFTISAYMVNQFEKKDGNTLTVSLSMDKIGNMPSIIPGSVSCVGFLDSNNKQIAICLPDKSTANQVLKAFGDFMKCRMGDNLKDTPAATIKNILKASCLGLDVNFDLKRYGGDVNKAKAALQTAMNSALKNVAKNLQKSGAGTEQDPLKAIDSKASAQMK